MRLRIYRHVIPHCLCSLGSLYSVKGLGCDTVTVLLCCDPCPAVKAARELIGEAPTESDADLGYGSRVLYHTVAGLLGLCGAAVTSDDRANAKQHFSRALKMAHKHLHNHQVVSQLLLVMAPLQVSRGLGGGVSGTRIEERGVRDGCAAQQFTVHRITHYWSLCCIP
jgi:hypothetical protein